jgi:carboxymethylenebutenolidase
MGSRTARLSVSVAFMFSSLLQAAMAGEVEREIDRFEVAGKPIRLETFHSRQSKNTPSILVLHGSTGVEFANRFIAGMAQNFADQGFTVHLLHYFDRTGVKYADDRTIRDSSAAWLETVQGAVRHIRKARPKAQIGLFGYSLGGYLAAAESVRNPEVDAAVILAGGLDEGSASTVKYAPPMLLLHGSDDTRVRVSEARRLETALKAAGGSPVFHLYPGEGHVMELPTYADVVTRGTAFFRKHLR